MLDFKVLEKESDFTEELSREKYVDFLYKHLDKFGDSKEAINACIDYALSTEDGKGGFMLAAYYEGDLVGELIMNETGMAGYIPEYILVYVAVDNRFRGKGIGRQIVDKALELSEGDVALHVEYDNPAKRLYERIGFTTKYAEMRIINKRK